MGKKCIVEDCKNKRYKNKLICEFHWKREKYSEMTYVNKRKRGERNT